MSVRYGIPYMGSKNSIAEWILSYLPKADNFYDLFCGGCAITHCAIEQRKYNNYFINDIKGEMPIGFIECIKGKYHDDSRWISHEQFDELKGKGDLLVDICFSFGNNWRKGYAYSREIEPLKRALHYAVVLGDTDPISAYLGDGHMPKLDNITERDRRMAVIKSALKGNVNMPQHLQALNRLQSMERLTGLNYIGNNACVESLDKISTSCESYDMVDIKPNSVVYCDIPYRATAQYNDIQFDYDKFYDWCMAQKEPLFISEYEMPEKYFICIAARRKKVLLNANSNSMSRVEKLFIPKHQAKNKPLTLF